MYGADNFTDPTVPAASLETFTPTTGGGSWSAPKPVPFDYYYYPRAFLLPLGDVFIAGPQKPARRFDPAASPITDNPALQYPQVYPQRGVNMEGTAVLLHLRPPAYNPRVMICGGTGNTRLNWNAGESGAMKTAERIDLSVAAPAWQTLPDYFFKPRPQITSAPAAISYGQPFAIQTPTPNGISEVVLMRPGAVTHGFNMDQRSVGCAITGATGTTLNATAPPDGNVSPPGYHLLFLVDHDRTPSVGAWTRLS